MVWKDCSDVALFPKFHTQHLSPPISTYRDTAVYEILWFSQASLYSRLTSIVWSFFAMLYVLWLIQFVSCALMWWHHMLPAKPWLKWCQSSKLHVWIVIEYVTAMLPVYLCAYMQIYIKYTCLWTYNIHACVPSYMYILYAYMYACILYCHFRIS